MFNSAFIPHAAQGVVPVADAFAGGVSSDVIFLQHYRCALFTIITGAIEDAGISNVVTVDACDDATPTNTTAMGFYHRSQRWSTTVNTWSNAWTAAAAAGYNFTVNHAVANAIHQVIVTGEMIEQAAAGYEACRLTIAETANKTITACVFVQLFEPKYAQDAPIQAIA